MHVQIMEQFQREDSAGSVIDFLSDLNSFSHSDIQFPNSHAIWQLYRNSEHISLNIALLSSEYPWCKIIINIHVINKFLLMNYL